MKHKELKELKKLLEKGKSEKKILGLLEALAKSNKSDFKEANEFCTKLIKKSKLEKKLAKKIDEKLKKLSKSIKKELKSSKNAKKKEKTSSKPKNKPSKKNKVKKPLTLQPTRVTKTLMVQTISERASLSKKDAHSALTSILETITESLTNDENVTLLGFGTFSSELQAQRDGFNPATRKKMKIPAHKVVKFKVGTRLKEAIK